jgi:CheY-like chemotaxis protein
MKTILIVDDNAVSRELMRECLEIPDRRIVEAPDGRYALDVIAELHPDLVLMDIQMPVLDGFAALGELRQDPRFCHMRIVAVTAFAMRGDREKALTAGFDGYITKPVDVIELEGLVTELLSRTQQRNSAHGF